MFDGIIDSIKGFLFELFMGGTEKFLNDITDLFQKSIDTIQTNVSETPTEFSSTLVDSLRLLSDAAILPVAGLLITYVFAYEIYQFAVQKNKGAEFDVQELLFLIFKTSLILIVVSNSFDLTLAVFDLGKWITDQVPETILQIPSSITETLISSVPENDVGQALSMWIVSIIAFLFTLVMSGIIYLVAWSRIITIMLYISASPIPFATLLNKDWIGSIGQQYIKQLAALMLQGYFMLVCVVVYGGVLGKASEVISEEGGGLYGLILMIVSMAIIVISLTRTHSLSKSILGVMG